MASKYIAHNLTLSWASRYKKAVSLPYDTIALYNSANTLMTQELLRLDKQICFPLYSASNMITRAYRPLLKKLDLTYLQYIVMMVLWEHKTLNVKELGDRLRLDSGTLTPLLKRLEVKQLVERKRCENDERVRQISLTKSGATLKLSAETIPQELACRLSLSVDEALEMKRLCDKLLASAEQ